MLRKVLPQRRKGPAVVLIGGGAPHRLLPAIRRWSDDITYITPASDDGGNSGLLADALGFPPGDVRRGTAGMADKDMQALADLFPVRFDERFGNLTGYCFGNIVYCALKMHLESIGTEAAPREIIAAAANLLRSCGRICPATYERVRLVGKTWNGKLLHSEASIGECAQPLRRVWLDPGSAAPAPGVFEAVRDADVIFLGPTSLYTSLLPILLVSGFATALADSRARRFLVVGVASQTETRHLKTASAHINVLHDHFPGHRLIDYVVLNADLSPHRRDQETELVVPDPDKVRAMGYIPVMADLLCGVDCRRHDASRLVRTIKSVVLAQPTGARPVSRRCILPPPYMLRQSFGSRMGSYSKIS